MDKVNAPLVDVIGQSIMARELLEDGDSTTKRRSKKKSSRSTSQGHYGRSFEEDSDTESANSKSEDHSSLDSNETPVRKARKSHKHGKVSMVAVEESFTAKSTKEVSCSLCHNLGHPAMDCTMNDKWCAIYATKTHNTMDFYYNGKGTKAR